MVAISGMFRPHDDALREQELRTYMSNGTTPEELEARAVARKVERQERKRIRDAYLAGRAAATPAYLVPVECDWARSKRWWWNR